MNDHITISGVKIGPHEPCYIIAEAGVNHNGSLEIAKKLVDAAKDADADAVKFQAFTSKELVTAEATQAEYQTENTGKEESQLAMLQRLELADKIFAELKAYCDTRGILFLTTPHTADKLDMLDKLVPAFKIGSGDLTNQPFLEAVADRGKPIILPTGMSTLAEVQEAVDVILKRGNKQIVLLHCTTNYPCPRNEVNLRAMETLKTLGQLTGYSDHTMGIDVSQMAVQMGAVLIEKHFTLDRTMDGPDHKASLEPSELKEMVIRIKNGSYKEVLLDEEVLGNSIKQPTENERKIMLVARKSIVVAAPIVKGEKFTPENLTIKRPGTGLAPKYYSSLLGKTAKKDFNVDDLLSMEDVA